MFKRVLHAANQVVVHEETHTGIRELTIDRTVNDKVDILMVTGSSWQFVQGEITDEDGNVIQPAMPSPEHPSEIISVSGELVSCGWNFYSGGDIKGIQCNDTKNIRTIPPGTYTVKADVESSDTDANACLILFSNGKGIRLARGKGVRETVKLNNYITGFRCYASTNNTNSIGDTFSFRNIQITKDTVAKPYDRYRGNSITLPVLRNLPDGTHDTLYVDRRNKRAWVERCVREFEIRSTDSRIAGQIFTKGYYDIGNSTNVAFVLRDMSTEHKGRGFGFCNSLPFSAYSWENESYVGYCFNVNQLHLRFPNITLGVSDDATSEEKKQAWLDYVNRRYDVGNPIIVLYPLKEPTIEELPYTDYLLETAQYQTHIRIDCDEHLEPEIMAQVKVFGR